MAITFDKVAAVLNTVAAIGASLQASHALDFMSPTAVAVIAAVLAAINAVSHALAPAPVTPTVNK